MLLDEIVQDHTSHFRQTVNKNLREMREENERFGREDDLQRRIERSAWRHFQQCPTSTV